MGWRFTLVKGKWGSWTGEQKLVVEIQKDLDQCYQGL
jgi:hypothetical protein